MNRNVVYKIDEMFCDAKFGPKIETPKIRFHWVNFTQIQIQINNQYFRTKWKKKNNKHLIQVEMSTNIFHRFFPSLLPKLLILFQTFFCLIIHRRKVMNSEISHISFSNQKLNTRPKELLIHVLDVSIKKRKKEKMLKLSH